MDKSTNGRQGVPISPGNAGERPGTQTGCSLPVSSTPTRALIRVGKKTQNRYGKPRKEHSYACLPSLPRTLVGSNC